MNYAFDFEGFIYKKPRLKLSQFLKKEKIPLCPLLLLGQKKSKGRRLTEIKQGPGIYIIFCKLKQKIYLGQSRNICSRLGHHWHTLNNNCHDCIELQKDWNALKLEQFVFVCLCVGSEWEDEKKRKKLENDLVKKNLFFYNVGSIKKQEDKYKKAIKYKSIFYSSISEALIHLNIAETSMGRKLKDPNEKEFEYVDSSKWNPQLVNIEKSKPVYINGVYYRSERYASQQTGINRSTLRRHLQSNKHDYCYYFSIL